MEIALTMLEILQILPVRVLQKDGKNFEKLQQKFLWRLYTMTGQMIPVFTGEIGVIS
ncbi:hypothetical protein [Thalassotalea litorea]|uniref:hypothetical protein n=1 Tax=Thalassotalea litorea TaxID=2020715 RepID=UPI003736671B